MINRRIKKEVNRGKPFEIDVDRERILAYKGETIAAALLAVNKRTCRWTNKMKQPRGIYCGMGVCMGCAMVVNGRPHTLVCQTMATPHCKVQTQIGSGKPSYSALWAIRRVTAACKIRDYPKDSDACAR